MPVIPILRTVYARSQPVSERKKQQQQQKQIQEYVYPNKCCTQQYLTSHSFSTEFSNPFLLILYRFSFCLLFFIFLRQSLQWSRVTSNFKVKANSGLLNPLSPPFKYVDHHVCVYHYICTTMPCAQKVKI